MTILDRPAYGLSLRSCRDSSGGEAQRLAGIANCTDGATPFVEKNASAHTRLFRWRIRVAVSNSCGILSTIRCTPAMAAAVIDRLWSMHDLFDAVTEHSAQVRAKESHDRRILRLIDRLQREE